MLFQHVISNDSHVLLILLPPKFDSHYELRKRRHNRQLVPQTLICSITILSFSYFTEVVTSCLVQFLLSYVFSVFN